MPLLQRETDSFISRGFVDSEPLVITASLGGRICAVGWSTEPDGSASLRELWSFDSDPAHAKKLNTLKVARLAEMSGTEGAGFWIGTGGINVAGGGSFEVHYCG